MAILPRERSSRLVSSSSRVTGSTVLVSIDGMSPALYLDPRTPCRAIREMALGGVYAEAAVPVFPTLSMTNHATLATGVHSDVHGIHGNTRFVAEEVTSWQGGESKDWFIETRHLRAPAIWEAASDAGRSVAMLRWPTTLGSEADWIVPEVFRTRPTDPPTDWEMLRQVSTPSLIAELTADPGFKPPTGHDELDRWGTKAALHILDRHRPDLLMIHLTELDHETHEHGGAAEATREAARSVERCLLELMRGIDLARDLLLVFGDHGFLDFTRRVHINALLEREGWIDAASGRIHAWRAIAHTNCSVAPVYVRDESHGRPVLELLRANAGDAYHVLGREELDMWRSYPGAIACVEAAAGFSLGQNLDGPLIEDIGCTRGEHGYRPMWDSIQAGFFACGRGVPRGLNLGRINLTDIAPSAAGAMGLRLDRAEGRDLRLTGPRAAR